MSEIIRVLRVVEYIGDRAWVEQTVANSIHGTRQVSSGCQIRAATIGAYPEVLGAGADAPKWGTVPSEPWGTLP